MEYFQPPRPEDSQRPPQAPQVPSPPTPERAHPQPIHPEQAAAPDTAALAPTGDIPPPVGSPKDFRRQLGAFAIRNITEPAGSAEHADSPDESIPPGTPQPTTPPVNRPKGIESGESGQPPSVSGGPSGPTDPPHIPPVPGQIAPQPAEPNKLPDLSRWDAYTPPPEESATATNVLERAYELRRMEQLGDENDPDGHYYRLRLDTEDGEARALLRSPLQSSAFTIETMHFSDNPDAPIEEPRKYHYRIQENAEGERTFMRQPTAPPEVATGAVPYEQLKMIVPDPQRTAAQEAAMGVPVGLEEAQQIAAILDYGVRDGYTVHEISHAFHQRHIAERMPTVGSTEALAHMGNLVYGLVAGAGQSPDVLDQMMTQGAPYTVSKQSVQDIGAASSIPNGTVAEMEFVAGVGHQADIAAMPDGTVVPYMQIKATTYPALDTMAQKFIEELELANQPLIADAVRAGRSALTYGYTAFPKHGKLTIRRTVDLTIGGRRVGGFPPREVTGDLTDVVMFEGFARDMRFISPYEENAQRYRKRKQHEE